jgi:hypothetical protein
MLAEPGGRCVSIPPLQMWFPCVYIKHEVFGRIGFLDERFRGFCDDLDFCTRAKLAGYDLCATDTVSVIHEGSLDGGPTTFARNIGHEGWHRLMREDQERFRAKYNVSCEILDQYFRTGDVKLMNGGIAAVAPSNSLSSVQERQTSRIGFLAGDDPNVVSPVLSGKTAPNSYGYVPRTPKLGLKDKSLCILTPMYGGAAMDNFVGSFTQLAVLCTQIGVPFTWIFVRNESLIPRGRNRLVDGFLKQTESTHGIFIDADIGFDPRDVLGMMELDRDIIGAACTKKSIRWDRVQRAIKGANREFTEDEISRIGGDFVMNFEMFQGKRTLQLGELQDMKQLGTGMLMVKREVFEEFKLAYPDRWYETPEDKASLPGRIHDFFRIGVNPDNRKYESEDYWFCNDCKSMGLSVTLMPWVKTDHLGAFGYKADLVAVAALAGDL